MHTLVFWAALLSLIPLIAGIGLEVLRHLRDTMAPPALDLPATSTDSPGVPQAAAMGPRPSAPH